MLRYVADLTQSFFRNQDQTTRRKSKPTVSRQYQKLEARQLLAADCPDIFVSFGQGMNVTDTTNTVDAGDGTGTGFVFVRNGFNFDGVQVDLASSNVGVAEITSATLVNSSFTAPFTATRFNNADVDLNSNGVLDSFMDQDGNTIVEMGDINSIPGSVNASGIATLQAQSINQQGLDGGFSDFDSGFDADADAFLFATFEFNIVGAGEAEFELQTTSDDTFAGPTGFLTIPEGVSLTPTFGDAVLTVTGGTPTPTPTPTPT